MIGLPPNMKAYNSAYMKDQLEGLFVWCSLEIICSFLIKMSSLKAIEIEIAFFHPVGNPNVCMLDHFFYA